MPSKENSTKMPHPETGAHEEWDLRLPMHVEEILDSYRKHGGINLLEQQNLPSRNEVADLLDRLLALLFPGYFGLRGISRSDAQYVVGNALHSIYDLLRDLAERCIKYDCKKDEKCLVDVCAERAHKATSLLLARIPQIRERLGEDIQAAYDGDPAAKSIEEVVLSYPSILAIAAHRIAHVLYTEEVPFLPRMISERAHSLTGIDIHPGARIGRSFFIDHGTGTVIGETTIIGDNVKLYQGVTLGALSFPKDERGKIIKGGKRHPTIEDNVVIYAGATILGGHTVIGHDSVIGGNCWIVDSIPPDTKVSIQDANQTYTSNGASMRAALDGSRASSEGSCGTARSADTPGRMTSSQRS